MYSNLLLDGVLTLKQFQLTGVTASNTVIVSPAPSDIGDYADCGVYCSAQGSGTLTFGCDTAPSGDIVVNVLIMS